MNVLFDLDGTLTDNFVGISRSINHALGRLGVPPRPDAELRTCVGPPLRESFRRLLATADPTRIEQAIAHYRERFAEAGWRENIVYAGMPELVGRLFGEGHRLWVCTSKPRVFAARIVEHFGLAPCFVAVYGVDLEGSLDTKADLMARLLADHCLAAEDCRMVGDRIHDVEAAQRNGVRAVGVLWGFGEPAELSGAAALAGNPDELYAHLVSSG